MARFPVIDSPCPYRDNLSAIMDGDFCRMCKRSVTDLTAMDDGERAAFLSSCAGETCVSYAFPKKRAMAIAAMATAAAAMPMAAAAQDVAHDEAAYEDEMVIIVGGLRAPEDAKMASDKADLVLPELPVTYEDDASALGASKPTG